mgnify:CR=1 FL=1
MKRLQNIITTQHKPRNPDGYFITVYDEDMNTRECLGQWGKYNKKSETELLDKVKNLGQYESRLTNGKNKNVLIKYYKITYLYIDTAKFSRGFHGVKTEAFYLPEVFLENTYEDGRWISSRDKIWHKTSDEFDMKYTIEKLNEKANKISKTTPEIYKAYSYYGYF